MTDGIDHQTIALWLFDEPHYPSVTLTDAGPHRIDLRLLEGGRLVPGRFGNALSLSPDPIPAVAYACAPDGLYTLPRDQRLSGDEVSERLNIGYSDWTLEFWFRASAPQSERGVVFELRNQSTDLTKQAANALALEAGSKQFVLCCQELGLELPIQTEKAATADNQWHHLAFTYTAEERQVRHYVDGALQPLPRWGGLLPMKGKLASFVLGRDHAGQQPLVGLLDEMRVSGIVRYSADFAVPGSFSSNYGLNPPQPGRPNGQPLLFVERGPGRPVALGSRKHVFIDDVLLGQKEGLRLTANSPQIREVTDLRCDKPWDAGPRFGPDVPNVMHVYDDGAEIRLVYTNAGMWGGKPDAICLATSEDGLHWSKPDLGRVCWDGSTHNNILLTVPSQGTMFKDPNPAAPPEERYKYVAFCMYRGIYVFVSPDGLHWRRNETIALPFECGGGVESFWDDQRGLYATFLRHEGHWTNHQGGPGDPGGRACALAETREILKPWPFEPAAAPGTRVGIFALPSITTELPTPISLDDQGRQVYRSRAIKYPWAPDTYLAFPWRYQTVENVRPGSDLTVSRDGVHWRSHGDPLYLSSEWTLGQHRVVEALIQHGLIRRGDEIWQYAVARFTGHGGASYGGTESAPGAHDCMVRLTQRLDGFVSLDATDPAGWTTTDPLTFEGNRLEINVAAGGAARVALLGSDGTALPGFSLEDCDPIHTDGVRVAVSWHSSVDVSGLVGRPVRVLFELRDAKLYAFQFARR